MKKVALLAVLSMGVAFTGFSQENTKPERMKLYPSSHQVENKMTPQEEIAYCEHHLAALDEKEAWIKQDPEELKAATESGWFVQAEETRKELRARINELKK